MLKHLTLFARARFGFALVTGSRTIREAAALAAAVSRSYTFYEQKAATPAIASGRASG